MVRMWSADTAPMGTRSGAPNAGQSRKPWKRRARGNPAEEDREAPFGKAEGEQPDKSTKPDRSRVNKSGQID
jgi:hypothetical protein